MKRNSHGQHIKKAPFKKFTMAKYNFSRNLFITQQIRLKTLFQLKHGTLKTMSLKYQQENLLIFSIYMFLCSALDFVFFGVFFYTFYIV